MSIQFDHKRTVFGAPELNSVVIGIDNVEIGHGLETPLEPAVDIKIVILGVELHESGPEQGPGKIDLHTGTDQQ